VPVSAHADSAIAVTRHLAAVNQLAQMYSELRSTQDRPLSAHPFYVTGTPTPWRLHEIQRLRRPEGDVRLRRMHCFVSLEALRTCLIERVAWSRADLRLVQKRENGGYRASLPTTESFEAARELLRTRMCRTQPAHTVRLAGGA
jgi:hypothetical protein